MNNVHFENKKVSQYFFWFVWFLYVVVYMTKNCFSAAMASIVFEGAMTKSQTGFITAMFYLVYAPLQIVGGIFADKYDPEKLIKIGLIGAGISNLIVFLNQNYYVVLIIWIFNAIVQFAVWPSIFKIISSQLVREDRKNSAYYISFSSTAGLILAYLVAAVLPKWQYNFAVSSAVLLTMALALHIIARKVGNYMVPNTKEDTTPAENISGNNVSTIKLFLESGFFILIMVAFIRTLVANSIKTLSATMLMESYSGVSPSLGNLLNMLIIGAGIVGTVIVKKALYPKYVKSAPNGVAIMLFLSLIATVFLTFVGKIHISVIVVLLCLVSCCLTASVLFNSFCTLRFAKFGKSGTAAGIMNAATSMGVVVNSYGVTILAEKFDWTTVNTIFCILLIVGLALILVVIPLWKRFKKKYHSHP